MRAKTVADGKPDGGGQLLVTPVGSVVVSTDALLQSADRLSALDAALGVDIRRILMADAIEGAPIPPLVGPLEYAREMCLQAHDAFGLMATNYTGAEALIERLQRDAAALIAAVAGTVLLGQLARMVLFAPGVLLAGALAGWAAIPDGPDGRLGTVRDFMMDHPELITSREFARFVSLVATSVDDATWGFLGVPGLALHPGLEPGDEGVVVGATTVVSLGALLGMFRETPVAVDRVSTSTLGSAPGGVRERLDRIPEVDQVSIEKYEADGMPPRYVVYVGPTETFSPFAEGEPFDLTSNTQGVAGLSAGSLRAVELAMADAGISASDEVVLTGFSQGGLIATMVVASGDWNVVGLETHGAPAGNIPLPEGIVGLAIRNSDDFVPALAGPQLDHHLVQVEREAFRDGTGVPDTKAAPAHQRSGYERTATAVDDAGSSVVREQIAAVDAFAADYLERPGGQATLMTYHATRVPG